MPYDITHRNAVEVAFEQTHERLLRRERRVRRFTAVTQQQPEVTAGQWRHHQEMIVADTVVKVIGPIGEAVQMNVQILKKASAVVLPFERHSKTAADAGIDAVGGDEVAA